MILSKSLVHEKPTEKPKIPKNEPSKKHTNESFKYKVNISTNLDSIDEKKPVFIDKNSYIPKSIPSISACDECEIRVRHKDLLYVQKEKPNNSVTIEGKDVYRYCLDCAYVVPFYAKFKLKNIEDALCLIHWPNNFENKCESCMQLSCPDCLDPECVPCCKNPQMTEYQFRAKSSDKVEFLNVKQAKELYQENFNKLHKYLKQKFMVQKYFEDTYQEVFGSNIETQLLEIQAQLLQIFNHESKHKDDENYRGASLIPKKSDTHHLYEAIAPKRRIDTSKVAKQFKDTLFEKLMTIEGAKNDVKKIIENNKEITKIYDSRQEKRDEFDSYIKTSDDSTISKLNILIAPTAVSIERDQQMKIKETEPLRVIEIVDNSENFPELVCVKPEYEAYYKKLQTCMEQEYERLGFYNQVCSADLVENGIFLYKDTHSKSKRYRRLKLKKINESAESKILHLKDVDTGMKIDIPVYQNVVPLRNCSIALHNAVVITIKIQLYNHEKHSKLLEMANVVQGNSFYLQEILHESYLMAIADIPEKIIFLPLSVNNRVWYGKIQDSNKYEKDNLIPDLHLEKFVELINNPKIFGQFKHHSKMWIQPIFEESIEFICDTKIVTEVIAYHRNLVNKFIKKAGRMRIRIFSHIYRNTKLKQAEIQESGLVPWNFSIQIFENAAECDAFDNIIRQMEFYFYDLTSMKIIKDFSFTSLEKKFEYFEYSLDKIRQILVNMVAVTPRYGSFHRLRILNVRKFSDEDREFFDANSKLRGEHPDYPKKEPWVYEILLIDKHIELTYYDLKTVYYLPLVYQTINPRVANCQFREFSEDYFGKTKTNGQLF